MYEPPNPYDSYSPPEPEYICHNCEGKIKGSLYIVNGEPICEDCIDEYTKELFYEGEI